MRLDQILNDIEPITGKNLQIRRLPNALTNATYQITARHQIWALRRNTDESQKLGINRTRETAVLNAIKEADFSPITCSVTDSYLLTRWVDGQPFKVTPNTTEPLVKLVQQVHQQPVTALQNTLPLDIRHQIQHLNRSVTPPENFQIALRRFMDAYEPSGSRSLCHHDWHPGNLLCTDQQLVLMDWEYAALGDPLIDWACVFSGFNLNTEQKKRIMEIAGLENKSFEITQALVEALSILWFHCRFPQQDWHPHYAQWLEKVTV